LHYLGNKAGMAGVDKEAINKKITELSKGSPYYLQELNRTKKAKDKAK